MKKLKTLDFDYWVGPIRWGRNWGQTEQSWGNKEAPSMLHN